MQDFKWLKREASPNWGFLPEKYLVKEQNETYNAAGKFVCASRCWRLLHGLGMEGGLTGSEQEMAAGPAWQKVFVSVFDAMLGGSPVEEAAEEDLDSDDEL